MNVHRMLGGLIVAVVCAACGGGAGGNSPTSPSNYNGGGTSGTPAPSSANTVIASAASAFSPASLTVGAGTTVTFTFEGVAQRDVRQRERSAGKYRRFVQHLRDARSPRRARSRISAPSTPA